jgi:hypothetical protein
MKKQKMLQRSWALSVQQLQRGERPARPMRAIRGAIDENER